MTVSKLATAASTFHRQAKRGRNIKAADRDKLLSMIRRLPLPEVVAQTGYRASTLAKMLEAA